MLYRITTQYEVTKVVPADLLPHVSSLSIKSLLRDFMTDLALLSMMRNVGSESQKSFWRSDQEYILLRMFIHEKFDGIYDSPFKLTFSRCLGAATCILPVASDMAPLYLKNENLGLKMVAHI